MRDKIGSELGRIITHPTCGLSFHDLATFQLPLTTHNYGAVLGVRQSCLILSCDCVLCDRGGAMWYTPSANPCSGNLTCRSAAAAHPQTKAKRKHGLPCARTGYLSNRTVVQRQQPKYFVTAQTICICNCILGHRFLCNHSELVHEKTHTGEPF